MHEAILLKSDPPVPRRYLRVECPQCHKMFCEILTDTPVHLRIKCRYCSWLHKKPIIVELHFIVETIPAPVLDSS